MERSDQIEKIKNVFFSSYKEETNSRDY